MKNLMNLINQINKEQEERLISINNKINQIDDNNMKDLLKDSCILAKQGKLNVTDFLKKIEDANRINNK